MVSKKEFQKFCESLISPGELRKCKIRTYVKNILLFLIWGLAIAAVVVTAVMKISLILFVFVGALFVAILLSLIIATFVGYNWAGLKENNAQKIMDFLLKDYKFQFSQHSEIRPHIYVASQLGPNDFNKYHGEDLLCIDIPNDDGSPSGITLNICDLLVQREEIVPVVERHSDGSVSVRDEKRLVTVFNGPFGFVKFPFKFKCNLGLNANIAGEKKIKTEDIRFNRMYKTYTNNQVEALCILTPLMMNKLMSFSRHAKDFKLSLTEDGFMYFCMSGNLFEVKRTIKKPAGSIFERFYDDISTLLMMVEEIKNNNKVFKM